jgi:MFS transporter, DHA1 family, multidrug resistance protein
LKHPLNETPLVISRRHFTWLLALMSMIGPFSTDTYIPAFKAMETALNTTEVALLQTLTVYFFSFAVMCLWHGAISDAIGRRPVVLTAFGIYCVASIGCMLAPNVGVLLFFRALQGLVGGAGVVVGRAIIRDAFSGADAQRMQSSVTIVFGLAPALAPVIGGYLVAWIGWRAVFAFMLLMSAITMAGVYAFLPETHPPSKRQPLNAKVLLKNYWRIFSTPQFQLLAGTTAFAFAGLFLYIAAAPIYVLTHLRLKETQFAWLFGAFITGLVLSAVIVQRYAGRISLMRQMAIGLLIGLAGSVSKLVYVTLTTPQIPLATLPLAIFGLGLGLLTAAVTQRLLELFPTLRGTCSSLLSFTQNFLAAMTAGVIAPAVSNSVHALAATALGLFVIACGLWSVFQWRFKHVKPMIDL